MKKIFITAVLFLLLTVKGNLFALTLTGIDTILTNHEYGFDFINQLACTTSTYNIGYGCYNHFGFVYYPFITQFDLNSYGGYGVQCGKVNLDSIKTAPPDSIFNKTPLHIDSIPQDSLSFNLGNSYIIKTGVDPRYASIFFAKIRFVGFRVVDSASHTIVLRFLWACNVNSSKDISTSGLDTFNLPTSAITNGSSRKSLVFSAGQKIFKVISNRIVVPKELMGTRAYFTIYNLAGKRLDKIPITNNNVIDLSRIKGNTLGVVVVKVERQN
jgi:hypothetical protein